MLQIEGDLYTFARANMIFSARKAGNFFKAQVCVSFLLLLYLAGNVHLQSFHEAFHSLEKSLHSVEQEEDPCHRAIYHEVKNDGCDHKTHVTEIKQCPLCHVVPINVQHFEPTNSFQTFKGLSDFIDHLPSTVVVDHLIDVPARAPPVI
jgi:hypothetical protein